MEEDIPWLTQICMDTDTNFLDKYSHVYDNNSEDNEDHRAQWDLHTKSYLDKYIVVLVERQSVPGSHTPVTIHFVLCKIFSEHKF
jgi:hypothetical protein